MIIQHNLTAMNSNRMLGITTRKQAKSTEKLSSGYKINRAADDAAGLSISEKMRKQIRGLTQASLNAEDGISMVQTAEGALNEVQDMLHRINELAVKSANGTNSEQDREYIQEEVNQLVTEIDRVAETTKFNELHLLKGKPTEPNTERYQKGIDALNYLTEDTATSLANRPMRVNEDGSVCIDALLGQSVYDEDGNQVGAGGANGDMELHTWSVELSTPDKGSINFFYVKEISALPGYTGNVDKEDFTKKIMEANDDLALYTDLEQMLSNIEDTIQQETNYAVKSLEWEPGNETYNALQAGTTILPTDYYVLKFNLFADAGEPIDVSLHVGSESSSENKINLHIESMNATSLGLNGLRVNGSDGTNATKAMDIVDKALKKVSTQRSTFGAIQNRLEHTIANLDNVVENTTASESQIRDTDMALEMVKYSNNNILAQAGEAMLTQANQAKQGILSLLGQ